MRNFLKGTNKKEYESDIALLQVLGAISGYFLIKEVIKKRKAKK